MAGVIKVGLVGARFAARFHWEGLRRVYGVPVRSGGGDREVGRVGATRLRARTASRPSPPLTELCDAVDVVDLCTPGSTHEPLAVAAFQRGKHVIIEKPFTGYYGPGTDGLSRQHLQQGSDAARGAGKLRPHSRCRARVREAAWLCRKFHLRSGHRQGTGDRARKAADRFCG